MIRLRFVKSSFKDGKLVGIIYIQEKKVGKSVPELERELCAAEIELGRSGFSFLPRDKPPWGKPWELENPQVMAAADHLLKSYYAVLMGESIEVWV